MSDNIETDIQSLKVDNLLICKPKKTDDSLFGKMTYRDKYLHLHLYNINVVKHKQIKHLSKIYTVLFIKVPKIVCKKFIDFDNHCIDNVKTNIGGWFSKALDENVIEEYYTSSIFLSKNDGFLLKLKLQGTDENLLENTKYDIIVALKGLRFYKQRFIPEWELINMKTVDDDFLNSLQNDEDDIWIDDLDSDEPILPEPDQEQIQLIFEDLKTKIDDKLDVVNNKVEKYNALLEELNALHEKLKSHKNNLAVLENISADIDTLFQ
jgi:hypothetical protein